MNLILEIKPEEEQVPIKYGIIKDRINQYIILIIFSLHLNCSVHQNA